MKIRGFFIFIFIFTIGCTSKLYKTDSVELRSYDREPTSIDSTCLSSAGMLSKMKIGIQSSKERVCDIITKQQLDENLFLTFLEKSNSVDLALDFTQNLKQKNRSTENLNFEQIDIMIRANQGKQCPWIDGCYKGALVNEAVDGFIAYEKDLSKMNTWMYSLGGHVVKDPKDLSKSKVIWVKNSEARNLADNNISSEVVIHYFNKRAAGYSHKDAVKSLELP